jgi:hypothetical protein
MKSDALSSPTRMAPVLREYGPYVLVALLCPGGSVLALFSWLLRHRRNRNSMRPEHGAPHSATTVSNAPIPLTGARMTFCLHPGTPPGIDARTMCAYCVQIAAHRTEP